MDEDRANDDRQQHANRPFPPDLLSYVAAAGLAVPVGALLWAEAVYLHFGLGGEDPPEVFSALAGAAAFGFAFCWPLFRAHRPALVVRRGCKLGLLASGLLPAVAIAVLLLWENASDRPDLGMGGMMLYALPYVALGIAAVLAIAFGFGIQLAERRLERRPTAGDRGG